MPSGHERIGRASAEIRDPIHGYIFANEIEQKIIDTSIVQRLRRIRQLAGCHLVYPGGQHSRFEHIIGSMYLAKKVCGVLQTRQDISISKDYAFLFPVAALLHDVGHGPFSHMFEEVMADRTEFTHEDMTRKIILQTEIGDILQKRGFSKNEVADLSIAKSRSSPRYQNDIIAGGLSVDLMDYLPRDSYFTGVEYGKVDISRIINSIDVAGDRLGIEEAAMFAFEALMIARYQMFRAVYFHRTVRAAELMLIKSMILADKDLHLTDLSLENFLSMTDDVTLHRIQTLHAGSDDELRRARQLANDYFGRKLLKCVFEQDFQRRGKKLNSLYSQKKFRATISEEIAGKAGVDVDDVYVDLPTAASIPMTSDRRSFKSIRVVLAHKTKKTWEERSIEKLPLIGAITGYMDVWRIYTTKENKERVVNSVRKVLGKTGFETKVSK
jgi:HD superfamily phosphohydrolase